MDEPGILPLRMGMLLERLVLLETVAARRQSCGGRMLVLTRCAYTCCARAPKLRRAAGGGG